jgi:hypothetical protein
LGWCILKTPLISAVEQFKVRRSNIFVSNLWALVL